MAGAYGRLRPPRLRSPTSPPPWHQPSAMGKKRKRPAKDDGPERPSQKRVHAPSQEAAQHLHPVISLYYPRVVTLRQYLLDQLPASSKSRRRRIASLGRQGRPARQPADDEDQHHRVQQLADLLDSTLVGVLNESSPAVDLARQKDFAAFTASQFRSSSGTDAGPTCPLAEVRLPPPPPPRFFNLRRPGSCILHQCMQECTLCSGCAESSSSCSVPLF